jgi:hypothetical protein
VTEVAYIDRPVLLLGAANAFVAVAMGAFGAHALRGRLGPLEVWHTAVEYHLAHALGLVLVSLVSAALPNCARVRWTATRPIERELAYRLELVDDNGAPLISQTDSITPTTSSWRPGTIVTGDYQLTPSQPVPVGRYRLRLSVLDGDRVLGAVDLPHRIVAVSDAWIMVVSEEPRVRFGEARSSAAIELRAADVSRRGNWLNLWLHWHALRAPGVDTKYFVHLLDAQGNVVAQEDGLHVKYTRPSSEWQADEMISDLIEMPLWNLSPGEYRISVGLTNPDTGERLPAVDAAGNPLPESRYIFEEKIKID